jgi:acyl carrier protein
MRQTDVRAAVAQALQKVAPEADIGAIGLNEDLRETLDIDSFDFLNVLVGLHERLGIEIPETDYAQIRTLGGLLEYVGSRV